MSLALLILGISAVVAGLFMGFFGTRLWEFGGSDASMVLIGAIGVSSGLLLMGLCAVIAELKKIARQLGSTALTEVPGRLARPAVGEVALEALEEAMASEPALPPPSSAAPNWLSDGKRGRQRTEAAVPEVPAPPADEVPRRRNPLASTSRRERDGRERDGTSARSVNTFPPEPSSAPDALEPAAPSSPRFEVAWPKPERSRPRESVLRRPSAPPTPMEPDLSTLSAEQSEVTVLKSGIVDGMAYSLYSDGSIEAELPEGTLRFASIDELRAHIDQRS